MLSSVSLAKASHQAKAKVTGHDTQELWFTRVIVSYHISSLPHYLLICVIYAFP